MIADDIIAEIRARADIVAVIGQHVQLKKAGRNWKGLCPFHGEKTPSFNVSPDKGFFHCFGCQKHGDVFTFVMELEGKSFVEAAEQLGARFGVAVPRVEESPELRRARGERVAMLDTNKLAAAFFREVLADPKRGKIGRDYLSQRGVGDAITDKFQLGYAPADWHELVDYLKAKRADLEVAVKLGLIAPQPRAGGYYDRYRDRLVCPVVVPGGDIVGFSARVIGKPPPAPDGSEPPKYINSPESAVYKKSRLLFGLAQAREGMQQNGRAVLVEGNFDVITLHQAGFTEVVAPLGTALTIEQVQTLKRLSERVVLLYDGDRAGYKATIHSLELCFEADLEVRIAKLGGTHYGLSGGVDPDSMVAGGGGEALRTAISDAISGFEYFCYEVWGRGKASADARARALNDAARIVSKVTEPTKKNLIVGTLASALGVSLDVAWDAMRRGAGPRTSDLGPRPEHRSEPHPADPRSRPAQAEARGPRPEVLPIHEVELLALLTDHPSLIASADADKAFSLLTTGALRDIYNAARGGQSVLELVPVQLPAPTAQVVLSGKYAGAKDPVAQLAEMVRELDRRRELVAQAELQQSLLAAHRRGDKEMARRLALLAEAQRKGDRELAARLAAEMSSFNRKQAD